MKFCLGLLLVRHPAPAGGLTPPASIPAQSPKGVDCARDRFRCPASPCPWGTAITAQGSCRHLCATQPPGPQDYNGSASQLRCTSTHQGRPPLQLSVLGTSAVQDFRGREEGGEGEESPPCCTRVLVAAQTPLHLGAW